MVTFGEGPARVAGDPRKRCAATAAVLAFAVALVSLMPAAAEGAFRPPFDASRAGEAGTLPQVVVDAPGNAHSTASDPAAPRLGYVGAITRSRALVGIVVRADEVTAYVCDGRKLAQWLRGSVRGGRAQLRSDGGARIDVRLAGNARGVLRLPGRTPRHFVADRARGRAGLFRSERAPDLGATPRRVLTGWVRLNNGSIRGASRKSTQRVIRPAPGVEVVLRAGATSTVGPANSLPSLEARLTGASGPLCDALQGRRPDGSPIDLALPGCGLPRAGIRPPPLPGPTIGSPPVGFPLSGDALSRFAAEIGGRVAQERARLFALARMSDPKPSRELLVAADAQAQLMLRDPKLLKVVESARAASGADAQTAIDEYRRVFDPYRDRVQVPLPANTPGYAVRTPANALGVKPFRVVRSFLGPWLEVRTVEADGDEWQTADEGLLGGFPVLGEATDMLVHARAGFDSNVLYRKTHLFAFDVPANAGRVEVEIRGGNRMSARLFDCFGFAYGSVDAGYMIWEVGADNSVSPATETPVVGGYDITFADALTNAGVCGSPPPPIPEPPPLSGPDTVLPFTAPAQGGRYLLGVSAGARASVTLGGSAATEMDVSVEEVIVRHGG